MIGLLYYQQTDKVHSCGGIYTGLNIACTGWQPLAGFKSLLATKNGKAGTAQWQIRFRANQTGVGIAWQIPWGFCDPYQSFGRNYAVVLNVTGAPGFPGIFWKSTYICEVNPFTCTSVATACSKINHNTAISNIAPAVYSIQVQTGANYAYSNNGHAYICLLFAETSGNNDTLTITSDQQLVQSIAVQGNDCGLSNFPYRSLIDEVGIVCF